MPLPPGTYPIGGPILSTLAARPAASVALRDAGVLLPENGNWLKVNAAGDAWAPAVQATGLPDGTATRTQLVWNDTLRQWEAATAPRNTFNNYPWFVLTRDDDPDQVVEAINYFLANRDSQGQVDFAGQQFRVTGGTRYPGQFQDYTGDSTISDVWPEGGPAAWWWAIVAADGDREEGYWIRYRVWNVERFNVRIAVHTTDDPAAGDWGASFQSGAQHVFNLPVFVADSRISVWMDQDNPIQRYYEGEASSDGRDDTLFGAQDAEAPLTLGGVDGFYRKGNATVPAATHSGAERSIYPSRVTTTEETAQPHPTFGTADFRVGGTVYDWAKGQIAGSRPDGQGDRRPNTSTPWSALWLLYTAPAPASGSAETITTALRGTRAGGLPPNAMYYGWVNDSGNVDLSRLPGAPVLQAIMPQHGERSAFVAIWVSDTALDGLSCIEIQLGAEMPFTCNGIVRADPGGQAGMLFVGGGRVPVAGRQGHVLTITPVDDAGAG